MFPPGKEHVSYMYNLSFQEISTPEIFGSVTGWKPILVEEVIQQKR